MKPSPEETSNGWDEQSLATYHAEREAAAGHLVSGNVVTEWTRPKPPIRIENTKTYSPHAKWRR